MEISEITNTKCKNNISEDNLQKRKVGKVNEKSKRTPKDPLKLHSS